MKEFKELFPSIKRDKLLQFKGLGYFIILANRYLDSFDTPQEIIPGIKLLYNGKTVMVHYEESLYLFVYEYNKDKSKRTGWKDYIIPKFDIGNLSSDLRKHTTELWDLLAFSVFRAEKDIDKARELGYLDSFIFNLETFIFTTFIKRIGADGYLRILRIEDNKGKSHGYIANMLNLANTSGQASYEASRLYEPESIEILSIFDPLIESIQKYPEVYELLPISRTYLQLRNST